MKPGSKLGTGLNRLKGGISRLNEVGQEGRVLLLSVDEIEVSEQVRTTFKNIDEMAETLRVEGQQTPIIVGPQNPETNKYPLHKGGRRYAAACLIEGFKLKAIVDATKRESVDYIASQLIENIHRDDLPPYDIAMGLRRMRDVSIENGERLSNVEIAKRIQKSESYVSRYLTLSDLPAEILTLAKENVTADAETLYYLHNLYELDKPKCLEFVAIGMEQGSVSRQAVRDAVKSAKGRTSQEPASKSGSDNQATSGAQAGSETPANEAGAPASTETATQTGTEGAATSPATPNLSHAKEEPQKAKAKNKGKPTFTSVDPKSIVIGVNVAMDDSKLSGYMQLDRVCSDPSMACVVLVRGGKNTEMTVHVDSIEIISIAPTVSE